MLKLRKVKGRLVAMTEKTRRRGDELEAAIYTATYRLIQANNLKEITFKSIADQAQTSRTVLYRHWDTIFDLLFDTLKYQIKQENQIKVFNEIDEGTLRADLIKVGTEFLRVARTGASRFFRILFNNALEEKNANKIKAMIDESAKSNIQIMDKIVEKAVARGELKVAPSAFVWTAFFDHLRYQTYINNIFPDEKYVIQLVDQLILPATSFR